MQSSAKQRELPPGSFTRINLLKTTFRHIVIVLISLVPLMVQAQSQEQNPILGIVNGREISQAEVDSAISAQLFPLLQQIYALRKTTLENLVTRSLLEAEAEKRRISVDELKKQLTAAPVAVSATQVQELYRENASAFGAMNPDEAKERLRLDLESQGRMRNYRAAISDLKGAAQIKILLDEPRISFINDSASPSIGSKDAAVTIVEFSDFQCPYCKQAQALVKQLLTIYQNDVRVVFKHLPLATHAHALASARGAFCAGAQNRFWQFHDALFAAPDISPELIKKTASDVGLDLVEFDSCLMSESSHAAVLQDLEEARRLGINSTPTFVINGKIVRGAVSFEAFKEVIDRELSRRTGRVKPRALAPDSHEE